MNTPQGSPPAGLHTDRARAASFGSVADEYDRLRPGYPDAMVTELLARGPRDVLDIGCGTGKLARLLAAGGVQVLGVEPDAEMARRARGHGLQVEVSGFEQWPDAGRRFDLITCAQAWHWVDPSVGASKARALLRPGGALALCWNMGGHDEATQAAVAEVYARLAPQLYRRAEAASRTVDADEVREGLRAAGFAGAVRREFPWVATYSTQDWLGLLATYSDHHLLPPDRWVALRAALADLADARGAAIDIHYRTLLVLATHPAD